MSPDPSSPSELFAVITWSLPTWRGIREVWWRRGTRAGLHRQLEYLSPMRMGATQCKREKKFTGYLRPCAHGQIGLAWIKQSYPRLTKPKFCWTPSQAVASTTTTTTTTKILSTLHTISVQVSKPLITLIFTHIYCKIIHLSRCIKSSFMHTVDSISTVPIA